MLKTKNLTIMFTDMKGFTTRTSTHSRQQLQHLLELQDNLMKPVFHQFDGKIVKTVGDAFLVTFESPTDAVLCGMKIQENIINHNARAVSTDQIDVRIAINSGEVNIKDNDIFGEPVNITSRIESIAEPNEVYFTEAVYLPMNKNEIPTAEVGYRKLKGIPEEIKVYKVVTEQTNLIRLKLKRQQMAEANANLAKDEINLPAVKEEIKSVNSPAPQKEKKPSFWKRHKKKIIIGLAIFFLLSLIGKANENKKAAPQKVSPADTSYVDSKTVLQKFLELQNNYTEAIKNNNQGAIDDLLARLKSTASMNLSPEIKKILDSFAQAQLQNVNLTFKQKQELKSIIKLLE